MNRSNQPQPAIRRLVVGFVALAWLFALGCASTNVNPSHPKAGTGYVDFYAEPAAELCWDIEQVDGAGGKKLFSRFEPVRESTLRLAFRPGKYRLQVTFLNRVILEPAEVDIEVKDGMITPVQVKFSEAGTTMVEQKEVQVRGTAYGRYGRATKIRAEESKMFRIEAGAQPSRPYATREQMPYARKPGP